MVDPRAFEAVIDCCNWFGLSCGPVWIYYYYYVLVMFNIMFLVFQQSSGVVTG